jgi:glycosyltransferase involved in cell wall biosynthesis/MoaA/NifB/PqqE/SkfB family radical SAM enzyme
MRILMIHPHDIYSHQEPWTVRGTYLAKEMVARGHEVKLVYHLFDPTLPVEEAAARQEHPFETIPMVRYSFSLVKKVRDVIKLAEWADVVHFQKCFTYVSVPAIAAGYVHSIPVHYDWDDWEYEIYNYRPLNRTVGNFINFTERAIPRMVDTVSAASDAIRDMAISLGVPPDRIVEGHVGGDIGHFRPGIDGSAVRATHDLDGLVVMYLGQLHGAQYCELFLHAARRILNVRDDVTFVVVGTGHRFGELHRISEELKIGHRLVFTGAVEHSRVPEYLAAADVVVACFADTPQVRCKSPLKICEYLAMGKAIVASEVGEAAKMVRGAGVLTKPGDVASLAAAVIELLDDPARRAELGRLARKRAEEKYNWGVTAESLLSAYRIGIERYRRFYVLGSPRLREAAGVRTDEGERALERGSRVEALEAPLPQGAKVPRDFVKDNLDLVGVLDGEHSFVGPRLVQLDVTNNCNNDCVACWCNSPLLAEERMPPEVKRQTLSFEKIEELLAELYSLGTREIYMAGGGEPTMHPRIDDIWRLIKKFEMCLYVNTNFTLIDEKRADLLVELPVDHMTVSTWAGTPHVYSRTHPNKTEETFETIRAMLKRIAKGKGGIGHPPFIKLYNVISHLNYNDCEAMIDFALEVEADSVEFTVVDTKPGKTDYLLLNEEQRRDLFHRCEKIGERIRREKLSLDLFRWDQFMRRISTADTTTGNYDKNIIDSLPCTVGWTFARILPDGNVNPCLKGHRYPIGNVYEQSFREIWSSPLQYEFRRQANQLKKVGPIFKLIGNDPSAEVGCYRGCDDLGRNEFTFGRLEALTPTERTALSAAAKVLRERGRYL